MLCCLPRVAEDITVSDTHSYPHFLVTDPPLFSSMYVLFFFGRFFFLGKLAFGSHRTGARHRDAAISRHSAPRAGGTVPRHGPKEQPGQQGERLTTDGIIPLPYSLLEGETPIWLVNRRPCHACSSSVLVKHSTVSIVVLIVANQ